MIRKKCRRILLLPYINIGKIYRLFKNNVVLTIAIIAALITSFIIPPDREYLKYVDLKTLTCLFCVLAVVCAYKNINFFYILARRITKRFSDLRTCSIALVYITFIGSMLIANDMALITFLPLGYYVLEAADRKEYMAFVFIMQNIAANLGGMLTPFGNPQNLFLYTRYDIPAKEFILIMLTPFIISIAMITLCCIIFIKPESIKISDTLLSASRKRVQLYSLLFVIAIIIVFRVIPYWIGLIIIPSVLFFADRKALKKVDYGLLGTFTAFFVFSGNMARIGAVKSVLSALLTKSTLLTSVISCQIISNVPSAILLSQFTENYRDLLLGVNIGGTGTLVASLASLITFSIYRRENPGKTKEYLLMFSGLNFLFLVTLTGWKVLFI